MGLMRLLLWEDVDFSMVFMSGGGSIHGEEDRGVGSGRCGFSVDQVLSCWF